ncbi:MAG: hypothetical protein JWN04_977 [Myxococcaceae bacterium]|nr:hypothetical protein [Myxococcaceae bacterium]
MTTAEQKDHVKLLIGYLKSKQGLGVTSRGSSSSRAFSSTPCLGSSSKHPSSRTCCASRSMRSSACNLRRSRPAPGRRRTQHEQARHELAYRRHAANRGAATQDRLRGPVREGTWRLGG